MPQLSDTRRAALLARIEEAVVPVFAARGFAACTTRQLAEAVGLSAGALYVHYDGKQDLYARAIARYQRRLADPDGPLIRALLGTRFPLELRPVAAAIRDLIAENRDYWRLWYVDVLEFDGRHFTEMLEPRRLLELPTIRARLEEFRAGGWLRIEPEVAFLMAYMQLFQFYLVERIFHGRDHYGVDESEALAALEVVHQGGMLTEAGRREATSPDGAR